MLKEEFEKVLNQNKDSFLYAIITFLYNQLIEKKNLLMKRRILCLHAERVLISLKKIKIKNKSTQCTKYSLNIT
jgi:hypothetical protein